MTLRLFFRFIKKPDSSGDILPDIVSNLGGFNIGSPGTMRIPYDPTLAECCFEESDGRKYHLVNELIASRKVSSREQAISLIEEFGKKATHAELVETFFMDNEPLCL